MAIDLEYLRQHYATLSDEALLAINRADLVEAARKCYEDELGRRKLAERSKARPAAAARPRPVEADDAGDGDDAAAGELESFASGEEPDWLEDSAEVYSKIEIPGAPAADLADARDALTAAGIPSYLDVVHDEKYVQRESDRWRLRVPANFNLRAMAVLERDIFNPDFVAQWKAHLETLPDEEVLAMNPESVFVGLYDRIERVNQVYDEEITRRGLKEE